MTSLTIAQYRKLNPVSEHKLQLSVARYLEAALQPPVWWSAIDHAGKLSPRQAGDRKKRGVKRGIADILIVWQIIFPHMLWIELKRPGGGSLSPEQFAFRQSMAGVGVFVVVCRSIEEVEAALDLAKVPRRRLAA